MDASADSHRAMMALLLVVSAVVAGSATAVAGNVFGGRATYYVAVFGIIGAGTFIAATRREPIRFVFLMLIVAFPVASALVPPGRIGLTVFDVVMLVLTIALIGRNVASAPTERQPLLPTRSLAIAWALCIPCVLLSQFPGRSVAIFLLMLALYVFFLLCLAELQRERGLERLVTLLSGVAIAMAFGVLVDYVWHVNLSMRGSN